MNFKYEKLQIFICDTVFVFDKNEKLICVAGSAGMGDRRGFGSVLEINSNFVEIKENEIERGLIGYTPEFILNGKCEKEMWNGSGYKCGDKYDRDDDVHQGGTSYIDSKYKTDESTSQNKDIVSKGDFTVPFIIIKLIQSTNTTELGSWLR